MFLHQTSNVCVQQRFLPADTPEEDTNLPSWTQRARLIQLTLGPGQPRQRPQGKGINNLRLVIRKEESLRL